MADVSGWVIAGGAIVGIAALRFVLLVLCGRLERARPRQAHIDAWGDRIDGEEDLEARERMLAGVERRWWSWAAGRVFGRDSVASQKPIVAIKTDGESNRGEGPDVE